MERSQAIILMVAQVIVREKVDHQKGGQGLWLPAGTSTLQ